MEDHSYKCFIAYVIVMSTVRSIEAEIEPSCGRFAFEEQLLEKVVRMEQRLGVVEKSQVLINDLATDLQGLKRGVKAMESKNKLDVIYSPRCPDGWVSYNSSCYYFAKESVQINFIDAEVYCQQQNGHLLQLETKSENLFIKDYLRRLKDTYYWFGLTDDKIEGIWQWNTLNTPTEYTDWGGTEPNSQSGEEDCAAFVNLASKYWIDSSCFATRPPICEIML